MTTAPPTRAFGAPFTPLSIDETALSREYAPSAFGGFYAGESRPKPYAMHGAVAVVTVAGPLDSRADFWCDGYDAITERVAAALADPKASALVLDLDSPGGMAAGNLDAARELRALLDASGKPCVAHAGTMACSAAFALACAADRVHLTTDGVVGSIGTIATVYDRTAQNEAEGLNVRVVRSGPLKADPHPDVPLTDASIARVRARVNDIATHFGAWVQQRRPACGDPLALQGAAVYGADAVTRGLADQVGTLADAISTAASMAAARTKEKTMDANATKSIETLAALRGTVDAKTDDEFVAAFAALRQTASQVPALTAKVAELSAALTAREAADAAKERAAVLDKHAKRGALTPAMQADSAFMSDLAPLSAESLDRVLARLPGVIAPVAPRAAGVDPKGADAPAESVELTAEEKTWAKRMGLTEESVLAVKRADLEREQALRG